MALPLIQVGIDHHLAPLEVRERLAMDAAGAAALGEALVGQDWVDEAFVLSTCNRTEVYVVSAAPAAAARVLDRVVAWLPDAPEVESGCWRQTSGDAAATWLLRVTAGAESAVVGETEIQGQVRQAHEQARTAGTCGPVLERVVQAALRAGKRARTETAVSQGGISLGHAAVQIIHQLFAPLDGHRALIVGAGTIATAQAHALAAVPGLELTILNRTLERADALAASVSARAAPLDDLAIHLARAAVVVFATEGFTVPPDDLVRVAQRRRQPLLLVDLGLPRIVRPEAADLPGVFLYDLEALETIVDAALEDRRQALPAVAEIVREEHARLRAWARTLDALPTLRRLTAWAEALRQEEVAHAAADCDDTTRAAMDRLTRRIVRRLLGRAAARVRQGHEDDNPDLPTAAHLRHVFGLGEGFGMDEGDGA